ncbi:MAG: DmsE family decaheme c-type cytochrome [Betaproteobacteria bacterium]|nr:DmsE family decaheme c-type cytochrome [Betaproteobacteria bacterium]
MGLLRKMLLLCMFAGMAGTMPAALAVDVVKPAEKTEKKEAPRDIVLKGDAKCTTCHDEADSPELLAIGKTRHGVRADKRGPECTSCHGESAKHIAYKGSDKPPKPDRTFGKKSANTAEERDQACMSCHKGGNRMQWVGSQHESQDVGCTSCHKVHTRHDKARDRATQTETCFSCHKEQRTESLRTSHHPIPEGKISCSSCHNPHGSSGPKMLNTATVNETCYTCHAEKRGPFLWEHPPASDNCSNCHTPHGSSIASLLKYRQPFLCASCHIAGGHSTTGIRSGQDLGPLVTPGATSTTAASQMVGKACTNCHTQVHGSNHPSGPRFAR